MKKCAPSVRPTFTIRRKKTRISAGFDIKSLREAIISVAPRGGLEPPTNGLTVFQSDPTLLFTNYH